MREPHARAALLVMGGWLAASALARVVTTADATASYVLPERSLGPGAWAPVRVLGDWPMMLEGAVSLLGLALVPAMAALVAGSWDDDAARTRALVSLGIVDVVLALLLVEHFGPFGRTHAAGLLWTGARVLLLVSAAAALCWGAARPRALALAGAVLVAARVAVLWWANGALAEAPLLATREARGLLVATNGGLDALGLALLAAALALAARAPAPPSPIPAGAPG